MISKAILSLDTDNDDADGDDYDVDDVVPTMIPLLLQLLTVIMTMMTVMRFAGCKSSQSLQNECLIAVFQRSDM